MKPEINEYLKSLLTSRNTLAQQINTEGEQILLAKMEADKAHKSDCPCVTKTGECTDTSFQEAMGTIEERITAQKALREEIGSLDSLIGSAESMKELEADATKVGADPTKPLTEQGMVNIAQTVLQNRQKTSFYERMATDFYHYLNQNHLNKREDVKSRPVTGTSVLKGGETFNTVASFHAAFGTNQREIVSTSKSLAKELGYGDDVINALKVRREAFAKSMFTQVPGLTGGDGDVYAPDEVFGGNTGGLCEYIIDDTIDVLPYAPVTFLDCIPVRRIPKSYVLYVRQTLRINNASAVNEAVILPTTDNPTGATLTFTPLKPESEFGFTQAKAYTLTFADTIPVSEEFLEDCPAIADAVETQLMENVRQEFYDQIINGDGSTGQFPELIGLLAQVGLSTRVHQGAASFFGNTMGAGAATDDIRDTLIRAMFDAEAYGYSVDCILMSYEDYTQMYFLKDGDDRRLYSDAELNTIRGAKVRADVRMPAGTALVGAFRQVVQLLIRRAVRLDIGWVDKQFRQDMLTLRATMRGGLLVKAPHALIRVTGI